jgi:hypothetical protein
VEFCATCAGLLPLHVQFWETENSWRLDSSHRGAIVAIFLVDASDVRTVNVPKTPPAWSMSAPMAIF